MNSTYPIERKSLEQIISDLGASQTILGKQDIVQEYLRSVENLNDRAENFASIIGSGTFLNLNSTLAIATISKNIGLQTENLAVFSTIVYSQNLEAKERFVGCCVSKGIIDLEYFKVCEQSPSSNPALASSGKGFPLSLGALQRR